jgi:hypothetical protein
MTQTIHLSVKFTFKEQVAVVPREVLTLIEELVVAVVVQVIVYICHLLLLLQM